ncbi:hypothetical protein RMSM_05467 [Rhodopirellula maiorica SM1]|uniref:Uncharacterized protein n=1 Tax=Rhodopirellula maiorica SM1 TaxID=1265738 RepID=M5RDR0_9BACT|nr:hypothetical protein RMSM_05467 [Rhodopirellula maiorica SM1]
MANRGHKAYPNIRKTPFYSPRVRELGGFEMENLSGVPGDACRYPTGPTQ